MPVTTRRSLPGEMIVSCPVIKEPTGVDYNNNNNKTKKMSVIKKLFIILIITKNTLYTEEIT